MGQGRSANTALVKLSPQGNLLAGAIGRTGVGLLLNPITVLKARYEVCPLDLQGIKLAEIPLQLQAPFGLDLYYFFSKVVDELEQPV